MTRFANHFAAVVVAVMITATSLTAITSVPAEAQAVMGATTVLA